MLNNNNTTRKHDSRDYIEM